MFHKSMRGRTVDMDAMRQRNETAVAIGNAGMNARGDLVGRGGQIVRRAEEIASAPRQEMQSNVREMKPSTIDPAFYRSVQPQTYEDVDFKTPQEIMQETRNWVAENAKRRTETPPQVRQGHLAKKPSANAPAVFEEESHDEEGERGGRRRKKDTKDAD